MPNIKEKLVELFYDNNVRCDQKIEGLADDVIDIITHDKWNHASITPKDGLYIVKLKNGNKLPTRYNCGSWIACEGYKNITDKVNEWREIE